MKLFFRILFLVAVFQVNAAAQNSSVDSLKKVLEKAAPDSNRVNLLLEIAQVYFFSKPDTCLLYSLQAQSLAKDLHMEILNAPKNSNA